MNYPLIRTDKIVMQELPDEILIYDLQNDTAYRLNETSAHVYRLCDGKNSVAEMSRRLTKQLRHPVSEDLISLACLQLAEDNLLQKTSLLETPFAGLSRREAIRKVGMASLVALPVIASLSAPQASHAASAIRALGDNCTTGTCVAGTVCSDQFGGGFLCRAVPGGACNFNRPDLCSTGCCTSVPNSTPVCCSN
jgi:hypothetical protein